MNKQDPAPTVVAEQPQPKKYRSKYQPIWEILRRDGSVSVTLNVPALASHAQRDAAFKRFRKAISTRKEFDIPYCVRVPSAKIKVVNLDYDTMTITLAIVHIPKRIRTGQLNLGLYPDSN